jgi:hypothetical protein
MRTPWVLLLALAAAGCVRVHTRLTPGGSEVRAVEGDAVDRCTLLAVVSGTGANGSSTAANEAAATMVLRNLVAERGGNAYAIIDRSVTPFSTTVKADALRCPYWEPIPCLPPQPAGAAPCRPAPAKKP